MSKGFKIIVGIVLGVIAFMWLMNSANAGWLDSAVTMNWPTQEPKHQYKVSVHGFDVRVYEWVPKDNPDMRCVFVAGNENSSGVACYPANK